jgi:hypothetical protein
MEMIHDGALCWMGIEDSLSGGKRPGRKDDFWPPSNADVKDTCAPPCDFMAWYLVK